MKKLIILLFALFMFMSVSVLTFAGGDKSTESVAPGLESADETGGEDTGDSEEGGKEEEEMLQEGYEVVNPNHTQKLGGKSENAYNGLENAASRSKSVTKSNSGSKSFKANSNPRANNNSGNNKNGGNKNNGNKDKGNNGKRKK